MEDKLEEILKIANINEDSRFLDGAQIEWFYDDSKHHYTYMMITKNYTSQIGELISRMKTTTHFSAHHSEIQERNTSELLEDIILQQRKCLAVLKDVVDKFRDVEKNSVSNRNLLNIYGSCVKLLLKSNREIEDYIYEMKSQLFNNLIVFAENILQRKIENEEKEIILRDQSYIKNYFEGKSQKYTLIKFERFRLAIEEIYTIFRSLDKVTSGLESSKSILINCEDLVARNDDIESNIKMAKGHIVIAETGCTGIGSLVRRRRKRKLLFMIFVFLVLLSILLPILCFKYFIKN